jgi:hypothetical protein
MIDPDQVAAFARRLAAEQPGSAAYQAIQAEFLGYVGELLRQFSHHYHDFSPLPDGNIRCTMDDYLTTRQRVAYVLDTRTGFLWPVDKDVQRGTRYQDISTRRTQDTTDGRSPDTSRG